MKFSRRLSIEWKLPLAISGVFVAVVVALAWIAYLDVAQASREAVEHRLSGVVEQFSGLLAGEASSAAKVLRQRAARPEVRAYLQSPGDWTHPGAVTALTADLPNPQRVLALEIRDLNGRRLLAAGADTTAVSGVLADSLIARTAGDSGSVGPFLQSRKSVVLPTVVPVTDGGARLGYLVEWRRIETSPESRQQMLNLIGPGSALYLGRPGGPWTDQAAIVDPPPRDVTGSAGLISYNRRGAGPRIAAASRIPGSPWTLLIEFPEQMVMAAPDRFLHRVVLIAGALFIVGILGVWLLSRRITQPLRSLISASEVISRGDYSQRVEVGRNDELGRLAASFNTMAARVQETHERLEANLAELRSTREQFAHAQRMEAVGRLAGGVAHDFNNLLTVILGETELALARPPADSATEVALTDIRRAGERAAILTRQLLAFSRRQLIEPTVFSLNDLVVDLEKMLGRLIGENIQLLTNPDAVDPVVQADRGQMEQVVVNLVINARDAMPDGGIVTVRTHNVRLDEEYVETRPDLPAGEYVMLAVSDTGTGMSEQVKAHLFEPFFTTKDRSRGTGLGLATCYGIVKQSGGHIAAYSEEGVGTIMRVYLPLARSAVESSAPREVTLPRGDETILLVEDDVSVRGTAARILAAQGYRVLEAGDAAAALAILETHDGTIHLMLTDVILPGIGGRALAERASQIRPRLKVLYASGYTDDVILQHQLVQHNVSLLQKPFTINSINLKVREVLDEV